MRRLSLSFMRPAEGLEGTKSDRGARALDRLDSFGQNPGRLEARTYVPGDLRSGAPLIVVLHGCTQSAEQYDLGSGWSEAAEDYGFALLLPEQQRANNPNLCFNWFLPQDARRDRGEALSIRNMIQAMVEAYAIDPGLVFVTGLSAGGAMANVMLATYPEVFAGGAIIAGLAYGTARDVPQALERMRGHGLPDEENLANLVRRATDHEGPWPVISVWHGSADMTVAPANGRAIVSQWRALHQVDPIPSRRESGDGHNREVWTDREGRDCIEFFSMTGMGHGTPIATSGSDKCGKTGPYVLDKGISSTRQICRFWGLGDGAEKVVEASETTSASFVPDNPRLIPMGDARGLSVPNAKTANSGSAASGVTKVIEDALRAAGLMH